MSGYQIGDDLTQIGAALGLDLGHLHGEGGLTEDEGLRLFEQRIQAEAKEMATYYKLFYCLEKSIRELISDNVRDRAGANWWDTERVPQQVKDEVSKRKRRRLIAV